MRKPDTGHCVAAAEAIRRDAEQIIERLVEGEHLRALAAPYHCAVTTFRNHLRCALGMRRWKRIVHKGRRPGEGGKPKAEKPPADEKRTLTTGPECWYCNKRMPPDTRVCPNCNTLLKG